MRIRAIDEKNCIHSMLAIPHMKLFMMTARITYQITAGCILKYSLLLCKIGDEEDEMCCFWSAGGYA